ncbi:MAG TPA: HAMP domain-containing sensor histidine kinase [Candidatus Limnocylindrales bacterium]|nr:HAMP domain-containing sensor histidine kinase [Candidatus Limnocylindrales bacterium]
MPEGGAAVPPEIRPASPVTPPDAAEREALVADGRLVRHVRLRLVLWSGGTTLLVLLVLGVALYLAAARTLESRAVDQLEQRAMDTRSFLVGDRPNPQGPGLGFRFGGGSSGTFAVLANDAGELVGRRNFQVPDGVPVEAGIESARAAGTTIELATVGGVPVRVRTERVDTRIGAFYVQVIGDRTTEQSTLDAILRVLVVGGAVVVLVAFGFGAVYARRALVPIRDSLGAQRRALRRQREFAADASHELRTPLTVIRSSIEHLRRHRDEPVSSVGDALADIDAEVDHLASLVEDLLLLARSDSGAVALERRTLDLGDVAADAAAALAKPAGERDVRVVVDPEPAIVDGDPARLRQLVTILVDNAIRHSPSGGEVRVAIRGGGGGATLDVADQGSGIRPEDMPHVFERFWRATGSPSGGTGLGLAIAKWIVDRHHGTIAVANNAAGGAVFRVRLPVAGPSRFTRG